MHINAEDRNDSGGDRRPTGADTPPHLPVLAVELAEPLSALVGRLRAVSPGSKPTRDKPSQEGRFRDFFPLPPVPECLIVSCFPSTGISHIKDVHLTYLASCACFISLNRLAGTMIPEDAVALASAQRAVQARVLHKVVRLLTRLAPAATTGSTPEYMFAQLISDHDFLGIPRTRDLRADGCDLLERSAEVDVMPDLSSEVQEILRDPDRLFPDLNPGLGAIPSIRRGDLQEYARLVAR